VLGRISPGSLSIWLTMSCNFLNDLKLPFVFEQPCGNALCPHAALGFPSSTTYPLLRKH